MIDVIRLGHCSWHKKYRSLSVVCPGNKPEKNLIIVKTRPADVYGAGFMCTENYAETNLPGQRFNFQRQNLALSDQAKNRFFTESIFICQTQRVLFGKREGLLPAELRGESCHWAVGVPLGDLV